MPRYATGGFHNYYILPVIDQRKFPDSGTYKDQLLNYVLDTHFEWTHTAPLGVYKDKYEMDSLPPSGGFPLIVVLDRDYPNFAAQAPLFKDAGHCASITEDGITKHACLVAIEDDWDLNNPANWLGGTYVANPATYTNTPIPLPNINDVDILVQDIELTGTQPCASGSGFGPSELELGNLVNSLINRSKYVQRQYDGSPLPAKPIGWLLYLKFPNSGCSYVTGQNIGAIEKLSNAGYVGVIVSFEDPPSGLISIQKPYLGGDDPSSLGDDPALHFKFNTLLWNPETGLPEDMFKIQKDAANTAFYNFFLGCGNYYNGTKERYYVKQSPSACQCELCGAGETCTDDSLLECKTTGIPPTPDVLTTTGIRCVGPTLEKMSSPNPGFKCSPGCISFPIVNYSEDPERYNSNPTYGLDYQCDGTNPSTDELYGCKVICNKVLVRDSATGTLQAKSWADAFPSITPARNRGLVEPQFGYDEPDKLGTDRFTPTNCFMFDEAMCNYYIYEKMRGGNPYHRAYPIFDQQGLDNKCGLNTEDLATFLAEQSALQDMPSIVVR